MKSLQYSKTSIIVWSVNDELRNEEHLFETSELFKFKWFKDPHQCPLEELAQKSLFNIHFLTNYLFWTL